MMRWFLSALAAGITTSVGLSACMQPPTCGGSARDGQYSVGQATNFDEVPVALSGGTLEVDLDQKVARIVYPDGASFVEFRIVSGVGGQGGSN